MKRSATAVLWAMLFMSVLLVSGTCTFVQCEHTPPTAHDIAEMRDANAKAVVPEVAQNALASLPPALDDAACCCTADELSANAKPLLDVLDRITEAPYFRHFHVNVKRECPYWAAQLLCTQSSNPCSVCKCDADAVPVSLRTQVDMGEALRDGWADADAVDLSAPDVPIARGAAAAPLPQGLPAWGDEDVAAATVDAQAGPATTGERPPGASSPAAASAANAGGAEWVDLVRNPEGNTGYLGPKAHRVWSAIYNDNCRLVDAADSADAAGNGDADHSAGPSDECARSPGSCGVCAAHRIFYRLVSGMHTSISMHIASYFNVAPAPATVEESERYHRERLYATPNCDLYHARITQHPEHVDNLHFVFRFVIRALTRAAPLFVAAPDAPMEQHAAVAAKFQTGVAATDAALARDLRALFEERLLCSATFNESVLLEAPSELGMPRLIAQMRRRLANITTLMDCVTCEKCRLWGKLQMRGLAAAFRVVMAPVDRVPPLSRSEIVALVNLARQLTDSVHNVQHSTCRDYVPSPAAPEPPRFDAVFGGTGGAFADAFGMGADL
jgi:hypothetical protein